MVFQYADVNWAWSSTHHHARSLEKIKYLSADLRPVFPEERLLLELLLDKEPNEFIKKSVWAANSRYYIDGKSIAISSKTFQLADTDSLINKIS